MSIYEFKEEDAREFARFIGAKVRRSGDELIFAQCPFCRGDTKGNKEKFAINLKTGQYNCFRSSCRAKGNMITLSRTFDFPLPGYADEYYNQRTHYMDFSKAPKPEPTDIAIEYMKSRGIPEEITRKYQITTDKKNNDLIIFPFYDENNVLQLIKYRNTKANKENGLSKEFVMKDQKTGMSCKPILFGMNHCDPDQEGGRLIITEGQIDSLSVAAVGYQNVVSVPFGCNGFTWVPYCHNFLRQFKTLVVFGDHEHGVITLLEDMQKYFYGQVLHVKPENYKDCKDANDILRRYGEEQIRECVEMAIPVVNANFVKLSEIRPRPLKEMDSFRSGIESLDRILGGLYFGQLIILTGERGEGKSTLSNQLALRAVDSGVRTLIYSGELPNGSLRYWVDTQAAGPDYMEEHQNGFGDKEYTISERVMDDIQEWYSDNLWIYQNRYLEDEEADEDEAVMDLIQEAAKEGFRFIIIDNLMTAMEDDARIDLYRAQTKFVKQLSRIAKARDILIVLVAHQRKNQGTNRTADDVSGSSNITNLADVVLMFGKAKTKDATWPRELTVQKNRLTGKLGKTIPIWYDESSRRVNDTQRFDWAFGWDQAFHEIEDIPNPFE